MLTTHIPHRPVTTKARQHDLCLLIRRPRTPLLLLAHTLSFEDQSDHHPKLHSPGKLSTTHQGPRQPPTRVRVSPSLVAPRRQARDRCPYTGLPSWAARRSMEVTKPTASSAPTDASPSSPDGRHHPEPQHHLEFPVARARPTPTESATPTPSKPRQINRSASSRHRNPLTTIDTASPAAP